MRATAINTEISLNGKEVKAEDLGFNTDISNSQETTKDKEKHLNAELHTDLFNKSERNKLIEAKKKIETVVENLGNSNRFKEGIAGVELDKFKNERQKEFNLINDQNISLEDKRRIVQDLYRDFLRSKGYKGDIPEVILTDEENSFSVDSKDKETGEKRKERIFISINNLNNKDFSKVFVHELAHMNTYDEGYLGEETSLYTRSKLEPDDKTKVFSEADKEKYLESLRTEYPKQKSLEEQYAEAKLVADKDREHWMVTISESVSMALGYRIGGGGTIGLIVDPTTNKKYIISTTDFEIGIGTPDFSYGMSAGFYPWIISPEDIAGWGVNGGMKIFNLFSGSVHAGTSLKEFGIDIEMDIKNSMLNKNLDIKSLLIEAFPKTKSLLKKEGHIGFENSHTLFYLDVSNDKNLKKILNEKGEINIDRYNKILKYLKTNPSNLKILSQPTIEDIVDKKRKIDPYE